MNEQVDNSKLLADFTAHLAVIRRSPATIDNYRKNVRRYLSYLDKHSISPLEADADDIEGFQGELIAKPYPLPTVDSYMRPIMVFYKFLRREQLILRNPFELVELPRVLRRLPKNVPTEQDILKVLSLPDTKTNKGILQRAIMETLYSSAIRRSELCALNLDDVDTAKGELRIRHGKGDKFRVALIGHEACLWLRAYRDLVRPKYAKPNEQQFFLGYTWGRRINPLIVNRFINSFGKKAGVKLSPHSFRNASATHMMRHGASLMQIREMLGHVFLTTSQKYVEVTIEDLKREIRKYHPRK